MTSYHDRCSMRNDFAFSKSSVTRALNPVARNPPPLSVNWHFRSASILLVTPQLPTIQSIPEGRNQVPPSHFGCRFTRIYVTVEKKRRSQLPFHADFKIERICCNAILSVCVNYLLAYFICIFLIHAANSLKIILLHSRCF